MQRLLSLKRGSELLKNHYNTLDSLQSVSSKSLSPRSKIYTFSANRQFHHFSPHYAAASKSWRTQKKFSEKIYGIVSNPLMVKELLQKFLLKRTGVVLFDSRVGFMRPQISKRKFELNPSLEGHLGGWKSWFRRLTPDKVVLGLILANVAVYTLWRVADQQFMLKHFTVSVENFKSGRMHTLVTSAFSHIGTGHIISNMIGLYFFGTHIGKVFGPEFLLKLYLAGAVVGSIFYLVHHAFMAPSSKNGRNPSRTPGLGASGAVNAIMLLDIFLYPKSIIYLEFIIPVPAFVLGIFLIGQDMLRILLGDSQISGSAHLGGAVVAAVAWARMRKGRF